jgi:hypothetical protein
MAGKAGMEWEPKSERAPKARHEAPRFEKGRAYRFLPRSAGRWGGHEPPQSKPGASRAEYAYLSEERGCGVTLLLFQSVGGKWLESFTPAQVGDYEVREARE